MADKWTMEMIKQANKDAGYFWFDGYTMKFWDTHTEGGPYSGSGGVYFVTSEQSDERGGRKYSVRQFHPNTGCVTSQNGHFLAYNTRDQAIAAAKEAANCL